MTNKLLCDKYNISLYQNIKDNNNVTFNIQFDIEKNSKYLYQLMNKSLFQLIFDLNTDTLEKISISENTDNTLNVFTEYKNIGTKFGFAKQYSSVNISKIEKNNIIIFKSKQQDIPKTVKISKNSEIIDTNYTIFSFDFTDKESGKVKCIYETSYNALDDSTNLTKRYVGLLLKKMLIRLKVFVEEYDKK
tara:strand:- start:19 stop:588 length:570 start_codon:yes stop_codon:yes gene_type:complete